VNFFLADIPLLYETKGETLCDCVVVVACAEPIQLQRLMARARLSSSSALEMIHSQMPLNEKIARADHLAWNNGPEPALEVQAKLLAGLFLSR
jgi:dephospho-CoA kinase